MLIANCLKYKFMHFLKVLLSFPQFWLLKSASSEKQSLLTLILNIINVKVTFLLLDSLIEIFSQKLLSFNYS